MVELGTLIHQAKTVRCGESDYPVLSMTMHDGLVFQNDKFKKTIASKDKSDYKVVKRNQLVISFPIDEGVLAAQRIVDAGIVSPAYGIWNINQEMILPEFLEYALRCDRALSYYKAKLRGSTARRRSLPTPTLLAYTVPLPDISEQEHILNVIHKTKKVISGLTEEISLLDELVKARFVEMFGEPKSNKSNLVKIGEIGSLTSGGTPSRIKPEYFKGDIRWYSAGELNSLYLPDSVEHISKTALKESAAKLFNKGTLMIGMYDTAAFKLGILTEDSSSNQACANLNPQNDYNVVWLYYLFDIMKPVFLQERQGVRQKNLSLSKIKEFEVPSAPIGIQNQFAAFVERVNKSKAAAQKALDEAQLLFDSLMQKYFE